jgi:hypothetical protein
MLYTPGYTTVMRELLTIETPFDMAESVLFNVTLYAVLATAAF